MTKQFPLPSRAKAQALPESAAQAQLSPPGAKPRNPRNASKAKATGQGAATPQISIVLPVYNGSAYLELALQSVLAQSFADFELICVDDCSTDSTPDILADYAARDPRITVLRNSTNQKLPASLNRGFRQARGNWFTWTSDDNLMRPNMLSRLLEIAQKNTGYDIFHADFCLIDANGNPGNRVTVDPAEELVFGNAIGACFLYRRDVDAAIGGYDENLFGVEDYDFWLRASRQFRFYQVHEDLYCYRRHDASLTSARASAIHAMAAKIMERELHRLPPGQTRALGWINLMCRDAYHMRFIMLFRAFRDDPGVTMASTMRIVRWAGYALKQKWVRRG